MNKKIKNYIDVLFVDIPRSKKATELKEELLSNMNERFDDYIREGKSETESYRLVVANMGDVDELLQAVMPDKEFKKEARFYRNRNARNTAIAIALYIMGPATIVSFSFLASDLILFGVVILLTLVAIATCLIVYTNMSTPPEYKALDTESYREQTSKGRTFQSILSIYWSVIVLVYLVISFSTGRWEISWIIWPIAGILHGIVSTIYNIRDDNDN